jgi:Zn-finger nucleic acid-binding protein
MTEPKEKPGVFQAVCPCCGAILWIDGEVAGVIKAEKAKKKKGSLDDLLVKEKKRQEEFDRRFDAGFELRKEKKTKAEELFQKALEKAETGENGTNS